MAEGPNRGKDPTSSTRRRKGTENEATPCGATSAENLNENVRDKAACSPRSLHCDERVDPNTMPDDLSEHRHLRPADRKHLAPITLDSKASLPSRKSKSGKENEYPQNTPAAIDRRTVTSRNMVKGSNTKMEQKVPAGTKSHTNIVTKNRPLHINTEIFNCKQEENAPTERRLRTNTDSDISPTHRMNEERQPGLQVKGAYGYKRSVHTSVGPTVSTDADTHQSKDTELYRDRIPEAIEGSVDTIGTNQNHKNVFTRVENQNQQENAPTETLSCTGTYSEVSLSHTVNEDLHPRLQEKREGRCDRSTQTSEHSDTKILLMLASYTDIQLRSIIECHRPRLEHSIEELVVVVSQSLFEANVFTETDHKEIRTFAESHGRNDASKLIFHTVLEKGAQGGRTMWNIFLQLQNIKPELKATLFEIQKKSTGLENDLEDTKILLKLASYTDIQLRRIIGFYRQRLEQSIEDFIEAVSRSLLDTNVFTETDHEEIRILAESQRRNDASQLIFDTVLKKGAQGERTMWNIFLQLQNTKPTLKATLLEIQNRGLGAENDLEEIGLRHKDTLRKQNEKMTIKTTAEKEIFRRYFLEEKYNKLTIVASLHERSLVGNELKARGRELEGLQMKTIQNELEEIELDQLPSFAKTGNSGTAVVIGDSGIGKSAVIQKLIRDWGAGKIYQQFKVVFPFKVRKLTKGKTCLNSLIRDSYPDFQTVLELLWKEPRNILFIFDDLDQFEQTIDFNDIQRNKDPRNQCFDPEYCCEVSDIVRYLIQGELLKGCSVLITSRPWKLESLGKANINTPVKILGFTSEKIKQYFHRYFEDGHFATDAIEYIEQNDTLYTMCYNPLYCSVLAALLESQWTQGAGDRPLSVKTSTLVFCAYVTGLLESCGCDTETSRDMLLKLGELAYQGVCNKTVLIKTDQFNRHRLELSNDICAFMMEIPDKDLCSVVYTFTHCVMQDFVAALAKSLSTPGNGLTRLLDNQYTCADDRFKTFSRFLVGLSSRSSTGQLERKLGPFPSEAILCVSDWLKRNVETRVTNLEDGQTQRTFLKILDYFREFGDTNLKMAALTPIKKFIFTQCRLKPCDCSILSNTLVAVELIEELNLDTCGVQDEGIRQLEPLLHKCKILRLNENKLGDSGVKRLSAVLKKNDCKIQRLELKSNGLTDDCVDSLVSALRENRSLMELDLSNGSQDGEQANRLTDKSVPALRSLIQSSVTLKEIRLIHNPHIAEEKQILTSINVKDHFTVIKD